MNELSCSVSPITGMFLPRSTATQTTGPHLTYYGGKVLTNPKFESVYYGSYWSSPNGSADRKYLDAFAKDLVKSPHTSIWKEYGAGAGKFVGSLVQAPARTKRTVDETDLEKIVLSAVKVSPAKAKDPQSVYTVFLPPGVVLKSRDGSSSLNGLGGYHGGFQGPDGNTIYYAAIAYSKGSNGIPFTTNSRDNITITASHEWSEAVTDPDVETGKLGWYDKSYGEVGDIPIDIGLSLKDMYGRIDGYAVQKEWSNKDGVAELFEK